MGPSLLLSGYHHLGFYDNNLKVVLVRPPSLKRSVAEQAGAAGAVSGGEVPDGLLGPGDQPQGAGSQRESQDGGDGKWRMERRWFDRAGR